MRNNILFTVLVTSVCTILFFFAGCSNKKNLPPTVKVVINTWPGLGPFYIAKEKGFDKEEGINLEVIMSENVEARRSSLLSGEVDLVGITLDAVIVAQSNGVPMTVVGVSDMSYGGDGIIAKENIKTIADLKNKRIACPEGQPSHFFLLYLLQEENISPDEIKLVPADDGGQSAYLFTAGDVDAAVTWDPWISKADEMTNGHVLVTTKDRPSLILGIVAANENKLDQKAKNITAAMRAWYKAVEFYFKNKSDANGIMTKYYNVPIDEFSRMINGAKIMTLNETEGIFGTESNPGSIYKLAVDANNIWLKAGVISNPVDTKNAVDWRIINELSK
ncbi:MAG: ABC transporter substrate-binding protein [Candidatus Hodarchaeota archaeon]